MAINLNRPPSKRLCLLLSVLLTVYLLLRSEQSRPSLLPTPDQQEQLRQEQQEKQQLLLQTQSQSQSQLQLQTPHVQSVIGKVSMLYGDNPIYEQALKGHEKHNELHGYDMTVLRRQLLPGFWSKPAYILSRLLEELTKPDGERLEWIVWFDVDIIIMNYKIPLEIFLPPPETYAHINCIVTDDHRGLNNGVFFLRVNDWSVYLMTAVLGYQKAGCRPPGKLRTQDQGALENIIQEEQFRYNTIHVPQRWFNGFQGRRSKDLVVPRKLKANSVIEGDLLVHFAGQKATREDTMTRWLKYQEEHHQEWELDVDQTGYRAEIDHFWAFEAEIEVEKQPRYSQDESEIPQEEDESIVE